MSTRLVILKKYKKVHYNKQFSEQNWRKSNLFPLYYSGWLLILTIGVEYRSQV